MKTKLQQVQELLANGEDIEALRIVAKFPRLGPYKDAITRAWEAYRNPRFYIAIGKNPDDLIEEGLIAMKELYYA